MPHGNPNEDDDDTTTNRIIGGVKTGWQRLKAWVKSWFA